jgi:type I restriction enzyme S subunit
MEPLYFCNYLNSEKFKLDAKKVVTGDGRDNLNLKDFVKLLIPTPQNLKEQGHISRTSQKFDSLISSKKQNSPKPRH